MRLELTGAVGDVRFAVDDRGRVFAAEGSGAWRYVCDFEFGVAEGEPVVVSLSTAPVGSLRP